MMPKTFRYVGMDQTNILSNMLERTRA